MAWTNLTYSFGSKLTSTKMTQNQANFLALANGDAGAPPIQTAGLADGAATSAKVGVLAAGNYGSGTVGQTALGANSTGQSELKDATGIVSTTNTNTSPALLTLPGGAYGFYPQVRISASSNRTHVASMLDQGSSVIIGTSFVTRIMMGLSGGGTIYAQQRYFTASGPYDLGDGEIPLFVFALISKATGLPTAMYAAFDGPWHYNGPTSIKGKLGADGKKYKTVLKALPELDTIDKIKSFFGKNPNKLHGFKKDDYALVEITQDIKNADMELVPHPFPGYDLATHEVVMIDPVSDMIWNSVEAYGDNLDKLHDLFYSGDLIIDNTPLNRQGPPGVGVHSMKWKNTGA